MTPSPAILPPDTPTSKIARARVGRGHRSVPSRNRPAPFPSTGPPIPSRVFAGAFRNWHGDDSHRHRAPGTARAGTHGHRSGVHRRRSGVHSGPRGGERSRWRDLHGRAAARSNPACLSACDFGVAPFDPETHPALALGFYWSPLKIFEYMASGLPVVAPAIDRIPTLVGHNREGLLYDTAIRTSLAACVRGADRSVAPQPARTGCAGTRRPRLQLGGTLPGVGDRNHRRLARAGTRPPRRTDAR